MANIYLEHTQGFLGRWVWGPSLFRWVLSCTVELCEMVIWNERNLSSCCLLHAIKLCWWEWQGWILSRMIRTLDPASFPYKWSLADPMQRCEVVQKGGCTSHGQCEKDSVFDFLNHGFAFPTLGDQFPFHVSFTKENTVFQVLFSLL